MKWGRHSHQPAVFSSLASVALFHPQGNYSLPHHHVIFIMPTNDKAKTHHHKPACEKPTNNMKLKMKKKMLKAMKVCFYCTIIQDRITPAISVLTLNSLYCLDIHLAEVNWVMTADVGIAGIDGRWWAWFLLWGNWHSTVGNAFLCPSDWLPLIKGMLFDTWER